MLLYKQGHAGYERGESGASARMCAAVVPQQPPAMVAPRSSQRSTRAR
jgi:hypothetical protein